MRTRAAGSPRRVGLAALLALGLLLMPVSADAQATIAAAAYLDPTERYPHGVLGDTVEHATLELTLTDGTRRRFTLGGSDVFEDTEPRVVDLDADGAPEVIAVESGFEGGARLAVYGPQGVIAATPPIGQGFRWLAVAGAADLDGDGVTEIAYVDRPHLAKTLRIWRYENQSLTQVAALRGVTNHRIGEVDIAGGIRTCDGIPEVVVATADWRSVLAVRLEDGSLNARVVGPHRNRQSFATAMAC